MESMVQMVFGSRLTAGLVVCLLLLPLSVCGKARQSQTEDALTRLDRYNVVWTTASKDSSGSMPLGNGDVGVNAWVEQGGDILFYISKTDAWTSAGDLPKVGRVRLSLSPNPFAGGSFFSQVLKPRQGKIEIRGGKPDRPDLVRLWVDANRPVIWLEVEGAQPLIARVIPSFALAFQLFHD